MDVLIYQVMEYNSEDKERKDQQQESQRNGAVGWGVERGGEKWGNGSKREAMRDKKKLKRESNVLKKPQLPDNQHQSSLNPPEQDSSAIMSGIRAKKQKIPCSLSELTTPYSLEKLILKPPYLTVTKTNCIIGCHGHSTAFFKRPVIEGQVYMEFLVRQDARKEKKPGYSSAVRVGLCTNSFNTSFPLGYAESLAYKSADGSIVRGSERIDAVARYGIGDVIGVCMNISPPSKVANPQQISEGSSVTFYKNGEKVKECEGLKQTFYCFGVSLYNYGQVEVVGGPQSVHQMPAESRHYFSVLGEKIPYKELQNKRIFKL